MCYETVLRFSIRVKKFFSISIYLEFMGKKDNSGAFLLSTVFGTRYTWITEWCSEARPSRRFNSNLFRKHYFKKYLD